MAMVWGVMVFLQVSVMREMMGDAANVTADSGAAVPLTPRPDFASLNFRDMPADATSTRDIVRALRDRMRVSKPNPEPPRIPPSCIPSPITRLWADQCVWMLQAYEYWADDEPTPSHAYKEAVFLLAPDPLPASVNYQPVRPRLPSHGLCDRSPPQPWAALQCRLLPWSPPTDQTQRALSTTNTGTQH